MIGQSLRQALTENGLAVDWVRDGVLAQDALAQGSYAAVLLDLGLPRRSGLEVLRRAQAGGRSHADARAHGPRRSGRPCRRARSRCRRLPGQAFRAARAAGAHACGHTPLRRPRAIDDRHAADAARPVEPRDSRIASTTTAAVGEGISSHARAAGAPGDRSCRAASSKSASMAGARKSAATPSRCSFTACASKLGADVIRNVRGLGWRVSKAQS